MPCPNNAVFNAQTFVDGVYSDALAAGGGAAATNSSGVMSMGIGQLGAAGTLLKRKFRFLFGIDFCTTSGTAAQSVPPSFVKSASRPDITIEDTEISFLNQTSWIPGKAKWETIEVVYWDVAGAQSAGLFSWLATVYDFTSECRNMASQIQDYAGVATLVMLDGCGNPLESWILNDAWPSAIKFGEVAYDSSDVAEVSLTLRYSDVQYNSFCKGSIITCPCSTC